MHVLMLAKVCRYFTDFCIELYVNVLLFTEQDCMLQTPKHTVSTDMYVANLSILLGNIVNIAYMPDSVLHFLHVLFHVY